MTTTSIADLAAQLQPLLTTVPDALARETGFTQRARGLAAAAFCQGVVFGWLARPQGSLDHLARCGALAGQAVSPQAWHQRFTPAAARLLHAVLQAGTRLLVGGSLTPLSLLARFGSVLVVDSTSINLPACLAPLWSGCGGGHSVGDGAATLKVSVVYDLASGGLCGVNLTSGRTHDRCAQPALDPPRGSLLLRDRGYFALASLAQLRSVGVHFLTRPQANTMAFVGGDGYPLATLLRRQRLRCEGPPADLAVELGSEARLPLRLLAWRAPAAVCRKRRAALRRTARKKGQNLSDHALALCAYYVLVTDLAPDELTPDEALVLYRARWQIELLFRLWKSQGGLASSRSANPQRILCEVYAKLLACLLAHWATLTGGLWAVAERSLTKAYQQAQSYALALLAALDDLAALTDALGKLAASLRSGCRINTRNAAPNTCQLLLAPGGWGLG